jgi:hypothetical protein
VSALVLVEFQEDVPEAIRAARTAGGRLVAASAEAVQALEDAGAAGETWTADADVAREHRLGEANLGRVRALAAAVDDAVAKMVPGAAADGFSFARCWGQQLLIAVNAVSYRAAGLRALLARHVPSEVIWFRQAAPGRGGLVWEPGDSVWSDVCAALAARPPDGAAWTDRPSESDPPRVRRRIARAAAPGVGALAGAAARLVRRRAAAMRRRAASAPPAVETGASRPCVLVLGGGAELDRAAPRLDDFRIVRWPDAPAPDAVAIGPDAVARASRASLEAARSAGALDWDGFDGASALAGRWFRWFAADLEATLGTFLAARRLLEAQGPALVFHGEIGPDWKRRTVLEAAGSLRVPRALYQWGGNYGYMRQPYLAAAELRSDVMLTYTPEVADGLRRGATAGPDPVPEARPVGSLYFAESAPRFRASAGADRIVYVPSALTGPYRYGPYLCLDDAAFYVLERRIAGALARRFPGRVVLKLHPWNRLAFDPIARWARRERLALQVSTVPLEEAASSAAVWIIDTLATVLQQIALTGRPAIYVDTRSVRPLPEAETAIRETVDWIDGWSPALEGEIAAAVDRALSGRGRANGRAFVTRYVGEASADAVAARLRAELGRIARAEHPAPAAPAAGHP